MKGPLRKGRSFFVGFRNFDFGFILLPVVLNVLTLNNNCTKSEIEIPKSDINLISHINIL